MKTLKTAAFMILLFAIFCPMSPGSASAQDGPRPLEKEQDRLIKNIDDLVQGLKETSSCVSEAKTLEDLSKCRDGQKVRKYMELQRELSEIGMTREERKMMKSPREY